MAILCGTCAWADHQRFYPKRLKQSERLAYYAEFFPLVEVDSTYYGIPDPHVTREWVKQTPESFTFDVKAYRTLTLHNRGTPAAERLDADFAAFHAAIMPLADAQKLGILLFQFPPWFVRREAHQSYVESVVRRFREFHVGIEFRHRSWWESDCAAETIAWLRQLHVTNVVCDEPQTGTGTIPFVPDVTDERGVMFRLHGRNADTWYQRGLVSSQQRFDYKYSRDELADFLPIVRNWAEEAHDVHILMNNNQGDYAVTNALDWLNLLGMPTKARADLREPEQLSLFDVEQH